MNFSKEQRAVAIRMLAALLLTLVTLTVAATLSMKGPDQHIDSRLILALKGLLLLGLWVSGAIGNVARLRFFSADDIAGSSSGSSSRPVRDASAVLQNTLEQSFIAAVALVATATVWSDPLPLLVAQLGLFSLGRALFFLGYKHGAAARAFGFALTFYPTVAMLIIDAVRIVADIIAR